MMTSAQRRLSSSPSSHSMVGRSRWLVGSSSSRMSGEGASTRASAARRASPPETCAGSSSPCSPSCSTQIARLIMVVAGAEAGLDIGQRRLVVAEIRLLRQIADGGAGLHEAAAAVGLDQAGGDLQQRRFAGAVAADQADALARRHRQLDARQQRRAAKGQRDIFQLDQRRRHGSFNPDLAQAAAPAGAGCGGWSGRAPTETPSGRAARRISGRR